MNTKITEETQTEQEPQRKKSNRLAIALRIFLTGATLIAAGGLIKEGVRVQDYTAKAEKGYCTVLVYMDGSDLERDYGAATEDLREMEKAMETADISKEDVHIVVEAGGAEQWEYTAMADKTYGRFCISAEGAYDVEGMEARNMGEADTLTDFIKYGTQSYPAEHYGLVFWNHGAGQIEGFGCDNLFDDSSLSLDEIENAMKCSAMQETFSFISLDACLMSNIELAAVFDNRAKYLIASEELEPQYGYDYTWLSVIGEEMEASSDEPGRSVGEAMLRTYEGYYQDNDYKLTLSLIDLQAYDEFHTCFHQIMEQIIRRADDNFYQELGRKRKEILGFGNSGDGAAEIVDLMDFMEVAAELLGDTAPYELLQEQYNQLVVGKVTKGYATEPAGISIYLPSGSNEWIQRDLSLYAKNIFCDCYQSFLKEYQKYLSSQSHIAWHSIEKKQRRITLQLDQESLDEIASAYLTVFSRDEEQGISYLLSTDSDVTANRAGYLKAVVEEEYWGLQDEILCLIETVNTSEYTEYLAPVLYREELCEMHICFSEEMPDGEITAITPAGTKKQEYELQEGDTLYPLYPIEQMGETDNIENVYEDTYYIGNKISIDSMADGDADLMLIKADLNSCTFGFMIKDTKQKLYYSDPLTEWD